MNDQSRDGNTIRRGGLSPEEAKALYGWLAQHQGRSNRMTFYIDSYCRKLIQLGVPLERANLAIPQLNPRLRSRTFHWNREAGGAVEIGREHGIEDHKSFVRSPIRTILGGGDMIRRRLALGGDQLDYPVLNELRDQGYTDYLAMSLLFTDKQINVLTFATRAEEGFSDEDLRLIKGSLPALSMIIEIRNRRVTAEELLDTYIGRQSGEQVLAGTVKRGDGELIHAVLWACDLANFTGLSESKELSKIIYLLNTYFEAVGRPVEDRGGEILKFIGDALLAIFPVSDAEEDYAKVCDTALAAAEEAWANMASLNREFAANGRPPLRCGIALHVGDVMFGNVGTADRLDFTVIGPAVNLVSRIEALARNYDPPIVCTQAFAAHSQAGFASIGQHALKGIAAPQEVFTLERPLNAGA